MSPAKHPHITPPPCFTVVTTYAEIIRSPTLHLKDTAVGTKNPRPKYDFHGSNVHCLCFLAQASLSSLLVSFGSGFYAAIWPWRPASRSILWTVDVEMCLLLELREAFIWAVIWCAVISNERILCSRGNSGSSFLVAVLKRASFIIALDDFCDCPWRNCQKFLKCSILTDLQV